MKTYISIARRAGLLVAFGAAVFCVVIRASEASEVRDAQGHMVKIDKAQRIVSIGGAITEILYAMGLEDRIIGVDITSIYPSEALKTKPNVGYMRQLSPEGVLGLGPTLVLALEGAGPKEAVSVLEAASVPFVRIPDRFTGDSIVERIRLVAAATGVPARGDCLVRKVEAGLLRLDLVRKGIGKSARVVFVLSFANGKATVAGRNTAADGIIKLAGGTNAFADFEGYKVVSDEAIVAARPDAVVGMERSDFRMTPAEVFGHPAFALTPAAARQSYISMDGLYLLGFGPRTAEAASDLAQALYPTLLHETGIAAKNVSLTSCRE